MPLVGLQPFDPFGIVTIALLNPVVIAVALWLGWHADQWQKIVVAGFAAALAGAFAIWLVTYVKWLPARGFGSTAGLFVTSFVYGMVLASAAYVVGRAFIRDESPD